MGPGRAISPLVSRRKFRVAAVDEADFLAVGFFVDAQAGFVGDLAHVGFVRSRGGKAGGQAGLAEHVEGVALVLLAVKTAVKVVPASVRVVSIAQIMPGGDVIEAKGAGFFQEFVNILCCGCIRCRDWG